LLYRASDAVSEPIFSKMSLMKEFMMDMAFEEIPVSCIVAHSTSAQQRASDVSYGGCP
jgi:hypothetical protein